jgi:hypothetical protein
MKKLLIVLVLLGLVGTAGAQISSTLVAQRNGIYRLSTGNLWSTLVAIPPEKRDTTGGIWTFDTGGLFGVMCSAKVNTGGSYSIGTLRSGDGINWVLGDSIEVVNARTTAGFYWASANLVYTNNVRFTISNKGTDTVFFKFVGQATFGRN